MQRGLTHGLVFLAVVALHVALLMISAERSQQREEPGYGELIFIDATPAEKPKASTQSSTNRPIGKKQNVVARKRLFTNELSVTDKPEERIREKKTLEMISIPQALSDSPSTDWHEQQAQVAAHIAQRSTDERKHRSMANDRRSIELPRTSGSDGLFRPPIHKNGDSARTEEGEVVTWINGKCYATNKDFGPARENARSVVMVCKGNVGKPPIQGDLLEHLKPKYLKPSEP